MHRFGFSDVSLNSLSARTQTGCEGVMTSPGPITVFAPNDDAFTAFIQKIGKTKMEIMEHPNLPNVIKWRFIVESAHRRENMPGGTPAHHYRGHHHHHFRRRRERRQVQEERH